MTSPPPDDESEASPFPRFRFPTEQPEDLTDEVLDLGAVERVGREPIPPAERTRRTLLWVLGIAYVLLFAVNIGFALVLPANRYQVVGAAIGTVMSLVAGGLGAGFAYYFAPRDTS